MTETLANGYSIESTLRELFNEYRHDRIKMVFIYVSLLVHWEKVAPASERLNIPCSVACTETSGCDCDHDCCLWAYIIDMT